MGRTLTRQVALLALCLVGAQSVWAQQGCSVTVSGECSATKACAAARLPSAVPAAGAEPPCAPLHTVAPRCTLHTAHCTLHITTAPLASRAGSGATVACEGDVPEKLANGGSWDDGLAAAANATALNVTLTDVSFNEFSLNRALRIILNTGSQAATVSVTLDGCSMKGAKVCGAGCRRAFEGLPSERGGGQGRSTAGHKLHSSAQLRCSTELLARCRLRQLTCCCPNSAPPRTCLLQPRCTSLVQPSTPATATLQSLCATARLRTTP